MKYTFTLTLSLVALFVGLATNSFAQYCTATYSNTSDDWISNVTFGSINNTTGSASYTNYTSQSTTVTAGNSYAISVTVSTDGTWTQYASVWIDYNNDETFQDATERVNLGGVSISSSYTFTGTMIVPASAVGGTTRMRVIESYNAYAPSGGCVSSTYGEVEDYSVFIIAPLNVSTPDTTSTNCYGSDDAMIPVVATGGTSPYTYLWSTGAVNDTLFNQGPGSYSVTVTDSVGAMDTSYTYVVQPDSMYVTASVTQGLICDYDLGEVMATGIGGSGLYSYTWSSGSNSATATGLSAGTYTVVLQDDSGCVDSTSVMIDSAISYLASNVMANDVLCHGEANGTIDPGITGGVLPLSYLWSNSATTPTITVGPGYYSVTVEDSVGCVIEVNSIFVTQPDELELTLSILDSVTCPGDSTGSAMATVVGGVTPYVYDWQPSGQSGTTATGLGEGIHTLVVTDDNGCEAETSFTFTPSGTLPTVDLGADTILTAGGTYTLDAGTHTSYEWGGAGSGTEPTLEVTTTGTYMVTVTNEFGCEGTDEIYVEIWPTGIESLQAYSFSLYPNPAQDVLNLAYDTRLGTATVTLMDLTGSVVQTMKLDGSGLERWSVHSLSSGVYTVNIESQGSTTVRKLMIN
ncbi:MAG: T9SS type A sorting domain-containing protein [Flavobacteriales bacterium]|nr:T9SS type A sorting domain-containing protein [Flavobacteriales bacterium]